MKSSITALSAAALLLAGCGDLFGESSHEGTGEDSAACSRACEKIAECFGEGTNAGTCVQDCTRELAGEARAQARSCLDCYDSESCDAILGDGACDYGCNFGY